ncbi:MAG: hydrogenase maturation protease [Spirochaetes bacterium]|nr:hydrogenase maturation protease [Spirochaetota bacterium]
MSKVNKLSPSPLIIGLGDDYYGDDAIGLVLIRKLKEDRPLGKKVICLEIGKKSFQIIDHLDAHQKILIIDAVRMGLDPGEFRIFKFSDVKPKIEKEILSFHQFGLAENLLLADWLGNDLSRVFIFGIEPEKLETGQGLSKEVEDKIDKYVRSIISWIR